MRLNINNLFNTVYIAESNSNIHAGSGSETWNGIDTRNYVWFGFGTTWNMSLRYRFQIKQFVFDKNPASAGFFYLKPIDFKFNSIDGELLNVFLDIVYNKSKGSL